MKIDLDDWRTMSALFQSIKFYQENNSEGKYDRALLKEQKMLEFFKNRMVTEDTLADQAAA